MNKLKGISYLEVLIMFLVTSVLIAAGMQLMAYKTMRETNNPYVIECVVNQNAVDLTTAECKAAISASLQKRDYAFETLAFYVKDATENIRNAAKKVLKTVCDEGSDDGCRYILSECILDTSSCNDATNYDLFHYLIMTSSNATARMANFVDKFFTNNNISNTVQQACDIKSDSAGCKLLSDRCILGDESSCKFIINQCKDDNTKCDSEYQLKNIISLDMSSAGYMVKLLEPYYDSSFPNIFETVKNACTTNINSVACSTMDSDEKNCTYNNDDTACKNVSNKCCTFTGSTCSLNSPKYCLTLINACGNNQSNACKYGFNKNINRNCDQMYNLLGNGLYLPGMHGIAIDGGTTSHFFKCISGGSTFISTHQLVSDWVFHGTAQQSAPNKVYQWYLDSYGNDAYAFYWNLVGGYNVLSGNGDNPPSQYIQSGPITFFGVPHQKTRVAFDALFCTNDFGTYSSGKSVYMLINGSALSSAGLASSNFDNRKLYTDGLGTQKCYWNSLSWDDDYTGDSVTIKLWSNLSNTNKRAASIGFNLDYDIVLAN